MHLGEVFHLVPKVTHHCTTTYTGFYVQFISLRSDAPLLIVFEQDRCHQQKVIHQLHRHCSCWKSDDRHGQSRLSKWTPSFTARLYFYSRLPKWGWSGVKFSS